MLRQLIENFNTTLVAAWHNGNIVDGRINEVAVRRARLVLKWVIGFSQHTNLVSIPRHPGQLSLLSSAEREMSK